MKKNFPGTDKFLDIYDFNKKNAGKYAGKIDILTGGFPCQPFSVAGKRKGEADERYLWGEMLETIRTIRPKWLIGENVAGLVSMENGKTLERILVELEGEGYEVQSFIIPACAVEASHRRDRIWIVAHSNKSNYIGTSRQLQSEGRKERIQERNSMEQSSEPDREWNASDAESENANQFIRESKEGQISEPRKGYLSSTHSNSNGKRLQECNASTISSKQRLSSRGIDTKDATDSHSKRPQRQGEHRGYMRTKQDKERKKHRAFNADKFKRPWLEVATELCRVDDGVSTKLDTSRIKALGNAIVPQVAYEIIKAILATEL